MSDFDPRKLRNAFGSFMTGVTVVTAVNNDSVPVGFTANSFASVSLEPPLILVCPAKSLNSLGIFTQCEHFAVNVLADTQQDVSNRFASATQDRFENTDWYPDQWGVPLIKDSVCSFSCTSHQIVDAGDHIILIGEVKDYNIREVEALGYSKGGYFSLGLERRAAQKPADNVTEVAGLIIQHQDQVLLQQSGQGWHPPYITGTGGGALEAVQQLLEKLGPALELGPVYSIFENREMAQRSTYYRATIHDIRPKILGRYFPVEALEQLNYTSAAIRDMMMRYALESQSGNFGIYVGNDKQGDIHPMNQEG